MIVSVCVQWFVCVCVCVCVPVCDVSALRANIYDKNLQ